MPSILVEVLLHRLMSGQGLGQGSVLAGNPRPLPTPVPGVGAGLGVGSGPLLSASHYGLCASAVHALNSFALAGQSQSHRHSHSLTFAFTFTVTVTVIVTVVVTVSPLTPLSNPLK